MDVHDVDASTDMSHIDLKKKNSNTDTQSSNISLADFEITSILGQGSNGTVYKAYQKCVDSKTKKII